MTTTIITTAATPELAYIHDRRPLMLGRDVWDAWLDPALGAAPAMELTRSPAPAIVATPVSTRVGSVANDGPELVVPLG